MTKVILLNGVGCAGKTSIAKAMQDLAQQPLLRVEMDAFLDMMPDRYMDHPDGLRFEQIRSGDHVVTKVHSGTLVACALRGMRHAIAAMAGAGNNIVVDDVIFGNTADGDGHIVDDYKALLAPFEFHMVGIMAPLTILERREIARGDRMQGLARWQMDKVHRGMTYDLTIDTAKRPPQDCAQEICRVFNL